MRSRVEARWAAFFDRLGLRWEYEPFDAAGYIPDFVLVGLRPLLVEVKPDLRQQDLMRYTERLDRALLDCWSEDVVILGATPDLEPEEEFWSNDPIVVGLMGERGYRDTEADEETVRWWDAAHLFVCNGAGEDCGSSGSEHFAINHKYGSYAGRPCGHYGGDHHIARYMERAGPALNLWGEACTEVRWEPTS